MTIYSAYHNYLDSVSKGCSGWAEKPTIFKSS
jgi:hypothetical protein